MTDYRLAAIFPERFQCITVALKKIFFNSFSCKTISAVCRNIVINKQSHYSKDEGGGHRSRESLRTLRRIYHVVIKSFWNHQQAGLALKNPPKKTQKTQKKPLGWVFLKKPGFFPTLSTRALFTIVKKCLTNL
jgi:hypothetical protein